MEFMLIRDIFQFWQTGCQWEEWLHQLIEME